ncbi:hypothetical protein [Desulforamulus putei]|uniref:Uncharacterized protein n=1 Tax=Desulforamulus putei DSM 12395 TaxID=1121429 RepID=A0A1M4XDH1_9FIRM|nr:hypothetical protein [Desulforamulus putei]SHE91488.1 hypothetical protein SAMN02745133_01407 [Desulforamulus putei DSM 12395]
MAKAERQKEWAVRIACRLELWYVVMQDTRFNLRTQDTYRVTI